MMTQLRNWGLCKTCSYRMLNRKLRNGRTEVRVIVGRSKSQLRVEFVLLTACSLLATCSRPKPYLSSLPPPAYLTWRPAAARTFCWFSHNTGHHAFQMVSLPWLLLKQLWSPLCFSSSFCLVTDDPRTTFKLVKIAKRMKRTTVEENMGAMARETLRRLRKALEEER